MELGARLPIWTVLPFIGLLLAIAVLPLWAKQFWEHHRNKAFVALLCSLPVVILLVAGYGAEGVHQLVEKASEYLSFILLLLALFVIAGGIVVRGSLAGTPLVNTLILGIGAIAANVVGTTGASVLLIRPLLRANKSRERKAHIVVFFIFVVSNCGGLLTPLGDPPLYLGFLKGVPFPWTLSLWKEWLLVNTALLLIFNAWDQIQLSREERARPGSQLEEVMKHEPLRIEGNLNFLFLFGVVLTIFLSGRYHWPHGLQECILAGLALAAYLVTPGRLRTDNQFTWAPILEVAILFAGIFVTMIPALLLLNANANRLGVTEPWQFYWATGFLSSFLDNAPTYLAFTAAAAGVYGIPVEGPYLGKLLEQGPAAGRILAAISCGAVMMGANTYIGNGPNFMVKSIAEEAGIRMPSFVGYMAYSLGILVPLFVVITLVFFR